jgi:hypothetical protein
MLHRVPPVENVLTHRRIGERETVLVCVCRAN